MVNGQEKRSFKSYFTEKDGITQEFIRREFGYMLNLALFTMDLRKEYRFVTISHASLVAISTIMTLPMVGYGSFLLRDDLIEFTNSLHFTILGTLAICIIINTHLRPQCLDQILNNHASDFFKYNEPGDLQGASALKNKMLREQRIFKFLPVVILLLGIILLTSVLLDEYLGLRVKTFQNGVNLKLLIPLYTPFDSSEGLGFYFACALIMSQLGITIIEMGAGSYLYVIILQQIILQIQILRLSISEIENRANNLHARVFGRETRNVRSEQFEACLIECLKNNIEHYNFVRRHFSTVEKLLYGIMLVTFTTGAIIVALSIVLVNEKSLTIGNKLSVGTICLAEVSVLFAMCFYGERITSETDGLLVELYSIPWFQYGSKFQRLVYQFKEVAAQPIRFVAGGLMPISLETFTSIMNTSYSYYQFLGAIKSSP